MVGCATAASLFPFVGTIVYMILRPPEYLEDVRERELEMQAAEARLHQLDQRLCPHCDYRIERDFVRCPSCLRKLKERCANCSRPLDQAWTICPYCEADVPGVIAAARAPPPRRAADSRRSSAELDERALATRGGARDRARRTVDAAEPAPPSAAASAARAERRAAVRRSRAARPRRTGRARRPRQTS